MIKRPIISLISLLSSILLSSCATDCTIPNEEYSQEPTSVTDDCKIIKDHHLTKGTGCRTLLVANNPETHTRLTVEKFEEYKVIVPENQVWYDCTRRILPLCGDSGSFWPNLGNILGIFDKRFNDSLWFSVIAEVKSADKKTTHHDLCKVPDKPTKTAKFSVDNDGELILYPNDTEGHYDNNSGMIWLEIQRVK